MSLKRVHWLAAVCLALGVVPLARGQQDAGPPAVIATSGPSAPSRVPIASSAPAPVAPAPVPPAPVAPTRSALPPAAGLGRPTARRVAPAAAAEVAVPCKAVRPAAIPCVFRGQAPDPDSGSPIPPPPGARAEPTTGFAPYKAADAGQFNAPAVPGVVLPPGPSDPPPPLPSAGSAPAAPVPAAPVPAAPVPAAPVSAAPGPAAPEPAAESVVNVAAAITVGTPQALGTRPVSAEVAAGGQGGPPTDLPPPDLGTAPPQPTAEAATHTAANPPDFVPGAAGGPASPDVVPGLATDRSVAPGFWEKCCGIFSGDKGHAGGRCAFQSDHSFEGMISPVTNPFFFEDPRSLTELRPIFMYQSIPSRTPNFGGGDAYFFGTQARLAITDRFSVVLHELGLIGLHPNDPIDPVRRDTGFADIMIGPKYTFYRDCATGSVAAAGLIFDLPVGSPAVFQNVGTLSLDPYLSYGQTFGRSQFGRFNFLANTGYSFSINKQRSEFYYANLHLDYNIANANKFFPLLEMNWIRYTKAGMANDLGTEGADLINFGSRTRAGKDYLALGPGFRYVYSDHLQTGIAVQFPLTRERGLSDYRLTFDVIFRY